MTHHDTKRSRKAGMPPGTLVHIGKRASGPVRMTLIDYDAENFQEKEITDLDECLAFKDSPTVTWLNVDGVHQLDIIRKIGEQISLHPLTLEDIVNTEQRPKLEDFDDYIFVVLRMLYCDPKEKKVRSEQISLLLTKTCVISFQEQQGDVFQAIRERLRNNKGKIRRMGADYLVYALADAIVDNCFAVLETIGERIEIIEDSVTEEPSPKTLKTIHSLKRELALMRKSLWPLREVISQLARGDSPLICDTTNIYLRDVHDHVIQTLDTIETHRDMVSSMFDIYLSSVSNRMNEVMKVLTIFAAIFIPLTFIAAVYGMNFKHMPELDWRLGYPLALGIMAIVAGAMLLFFRRKKWL